MLFRYLYFYIFVGLLVSISICSCGNSTSHNNASNAVVSDTVVNFGGYGAETTCCGTDECDKALLTSGDSVASNGKYVIVTPRYAKGFRVRYEGNVKLVEISDPMRENKTLYKFALAENPTKELIPKGYKAIKIPVKKIICMTSLQLSGFIELNETSKIAGITSTRFLHNRTMNEQIKSGVTKKIGMEGNFDTEIILGINPNIIFISPFKRGGYESLKEVDIPLVPHLGYKEPSPLGQAEWIKFIALFINCEQKANAIFDRTASEYNRLKTLTAKVKNRPVVFSGEMRGGGWYTVGGKSFLAQIFKDAGADYFLKDNRESGGVLLDFETIYENAAKADYWRIMNGFSGEFSYDALKEEDARYTDFKAFKTRHVIYCNQRERGFYENSPMQPQLVLKDFIKVFHPELIDKNYTGTFYELLK